MAPASRSRWCALGGAAAMAVIVVTSLIPAKWQVRTGLPWQAEHALAYFGASALVCLAWPRRVPDLESALAIEVWRRFQHPLPLARGP
jgi:hypothetical protein